MKLRHFVCASAVILMGWLVVTFVYDVPSQRYPKLNKYPATVSVNPETTPTAPHVGAQTGVFQVSISH